MNVNEFMRDYLDGNRAMNNKVAESQSIAEQHEDEQFRAQVGYEYENE